MVEGSLRHGRSTNRVLAGAHVVQVHRVQHVRLLKVAKVDVYAVAVICLVCIEVMEGEVGGRLDMTNLALVPVQRH